MKNLFSLRMALQLTSHRMVNWNSHSQNLRLLPEVVLRTLNGDQFEVVLTLVDGSEIVPEPVESSTIEPVMNNVPDQAGVIKLSLKKTDGSPLTPDDIIQAVVLACQECEYNCGNIVIL